jgi:hypothetical protein
MVGAIVIAATGDVHATVMCPPEGQGNAVLPQGGNGDDLEVQGTCTVGKGEYDYGNANIYGTAALPPPRTETSYHEHRNNHWGR